MRKLWVIVHRWFGLLMAGFIVISGLTGAVISWDHEIDEWLNGHLFDVSSRGDYLPPLELASRIEAADPRARVTWVPLQYEEGHAAQFRVQPRVDPGTGKVYELGYNSVFFDPVSGDVQGRRESGKVAPRFGLYGVRFHEPGNDHGSGGFGVKSIYVDGVDARVVGDRIPGVGTAGDIFLQLQFPLHSGRIAGIPGRIAISIMGLVVAALSITGVVIWARKRRARIASHPREERSEPARADAVA